MQPDIPICACPTYINSISIILFRYRLDNAAASQQYLLMQYISLSWCDFPELVVLFRIFMNRGLLLTRKLLNQGFLLIMLKSSLRKINGRHHDLVDQLWNICVTNDRGYAPFVVNTSRFFPHSWLISGFVSRLTRRVPLVEQGIANPCVAPECTPVFSGVRVIRSFDLCVCFVDRCLYFWPLHCLSFFDLLILITPFDSSNSS